MRRAWAVGLVAVVALACGCAAVARKPPTPAADITSDDLARLPRPAGDRFFLILFGSHDALHRPQFTHTWATLVRVSAADCGPCGAAVPGRVDPNLDVQTISWLPVNGAIDARSTEVEPGRNFDLHESMRNAVGTDQTIACWGPYEVWHGFAHRFAVQKQFLDSGAIGYQCIDSRGEAARRGNGCNCIHAITDMDPVYPRWGYPLVVYGKRGTARVVRRLMHSPVFIRPRDTHDWLLPRLGLDAYKIERRRYVGFVDEHDPDEPADLDAKSLPLLPAPPASRPLPGVPPLPLPNGGGRGQNTPTPPPTP